MLSAKVTAYRPASGDSLRLLAPRLSASSGAWSCRQRRVSSGRMCAVKSCYQRFILCSTSLIVSQHFHRGELTAGPPPALNPPQHPSPQPANRRDDGGNRASSRTGTARRPSRAAGILLTALLRGSLAATMNEPGLLSGFYFTGVKI